MYCYGWFGGNWDTDYVFYLQFDLYACKNGIDYDEKNPNCSTYEEIIEAAGEDNSFSFDLFYPIVHYQPMVKENPLFVKYGNYYYHLSRFSNKIDRLYLQKYQLKDDNGWILKNEKIYTYWGYVSLAGDSYSTGDKRDLVNEGSSSRFYSFNIFINSDVVYYSRRYKSLFLIISDGLPNANIIFIIFRIIAKIFKVSSGNQKLTELLFENLQERPNGLKGIRANTLKLTTKYKQINSNNSNKNLKNNQININNSTNNKINETSLRLNSAYEVGQKIFKNIIIKRKNSFHSTEKSKLNSLNQNNSNKNRLSHQNFEHIKVNNYIDNSNSNSNSNSNNNEEININKYNDVSSLHFSKLNVRQIINSEDKIKNINSINKSQKKAHYIRKKLFPYKYYLCSIFIKNIDISKESIFFTKKFAAVYNFICQLFDVSSYLILQREFQILKSTGKYKEIVESNQKININDQSFNIEMKKCLKSHRLSILGKLNNTQDINQ